MMQLQRAIVLLLGAALGSVCVLRFSASYYDYDRVPWPLPAPANASQQQMGGAQEHIRTIRQRVRLLNSQLYGQQRVLCTLLSVKDDKHAVKRDAVMQTWGARCHRLLFVVAADVKEKTEEKVTNLTPDGRVQLVQLSMKEGFNFTWRKVRYLIDYIRLHLMGEFDWWLRADDDTYIVMPNALQFLAGLDPIKPECYGAVFKRPVHFTATGAGLFLSAHNFGRLATAIQKGECSTATDGKSHDDDVQLGKCLQLLKIMPGNSDDAAGRPRFLTGNVLDTVKDRRARTNWIDQNMKAVLAQGRDYVSDSFIGFHYVKPDEMHLLELLLYRIRPYSERGDWEYQ